MKQIIVSILIINDEDGKHFGAITENKEST